MTNVNHFDALEICLQAIDQGADVESCLARFPTMAEHLRPILMAATQARSISVTDVPVQALHRGKARVLQAAAEMRAQGNPQKGFPGARFFRLAATTAAMLVFLLTGGTGLVNASSNALPGDHLYPVKRSWEEVQLFFVFDSNAKAQLEHEFDHERVQEIQVLYTEKRVAQVNFQGVVQSRNNDIWVIDGLNIAVNKETNLSVEILSGAAVQVIGETDDGIIKAERIILIATPVVTPAVGPSSTLEATPKPEASHTPEPTEAHSGDGENPGPGGEYGSQYLLLKPDPQQPETNHQRPGDNQHKESPAKTDQPTFD